MCGIGGVLRLDGGAVEPATLRAISAAIAHRGPDDDGLYLSPEVPPRVGLVHRRLAIIDLSPAGHQPMPLPERGLWISYNGELYNYRALRRDLESRGQRFTTDTDTEVLLRLYAEQGIACLDSLRGMFAFAIWDERDGEMVLARDRLGIKPLVYHLSPERLVFASEIPAVLADPAVARDLDPEAVARYLERGYLVAPRTIFRSIRKLPAASYLRVRLDGASSQHRYWRLRFEPREVSEAAASASVLEALREAVALHQVSDVPVGAFLSGGLDSSVVAALAARETGLRTFTVVFPGQNDDEVQAARAVAARYGTRHEEHRVDLDIGRELDQSLDLCGEPFADPSLVPTALISRVARTAVKVCLSGDGGDEVFAGYDGYAQALALDALGAAGMHLARLASRVSSELGRRPFVRRLAMAPDQRLLDYGRLFERDEVRRLCGTEPPVEPLEELPQELLSRYQAKDTESYLPGNNLFKVDAASMRQALEVRVPLLDHVLVERVATLPARLKMPRPSERKRVLRDAARGLLQPEVLALRKRGFAPPIRRWLAGELRPLLQETLLETKPALLAPDAVRAEVAGLDSGRFGRDRSARVWALLVLERWLSRSAR